MLEGEPSLLEFGEAFVKAGARGFKRYELRAVDRKEGAVNGISVGQGGDGGGRPATVLEDNGSLLYGEVGGDRAYVHPPA